MALAVYVTEQLELAAPAGDRGHPAEGVNAPLPLEDTVTAPDGGLWLEVSATVTVHVVGACTAGSDGRQAIAVVVLSGPLIVSGVVPELA